MFCRGRNAGGFPRRSGGFLSTLFTAMLVLGVISLLFGGGAVGAFVGGVFLLPLLLLKMAFTVFLVVMVGRLLFGGRRPRPAGAMWAPGARWDRRPPAPGWWEQDDRRDMTPEEAEWERYLQQARDEVDRIDRADPDA